LKSFPTKLLSIILLLTSSCIQKEEEKIYDYQYRCGDFHAIGELGFHSYTFCGIVPIEYDYFYKKGYWEFFNKAETLVASAYFYPQEVTLWGGGCEYRLIQVTPTQLKNNSKIYSDSLILSKIENCFTIELKNGKSKLLQNNKSSNVIHIDSNGKE